MGPGRCVSLLRVPFPGGWRLKAEDERVPHLSWVWAVPWGGAAAGGRGRLNKAAMQSFLCPNTRRKSVLALQGHWSEPSLTHTTPGKCASGSCKVMFYGSTAYTWIWATTSLYITGGQAQRPACVSANLLPVRESNSLQVFLFLFFPPALSKYDWQNYVYLRCISWYLYIYTHTLYILKHMCVIIYTYVWIYIYIHIEKWLQQLR